VFSSSKHMRGAASAAPRNTRPLVLLGVLAVAGALASAAGSQVRGQQDPPVPLCSVVTAIDNLLGCAAATGPAQSPGGATAADALQEQPVHVVPTAPRFAPDLLLVRFHPRTTPQQQADVFAGAGVVAVRRIPELGVVVVRMPPPHRDDALAELRASRLVANAEKDAIFEELDTTPNDTDWSAQWGLRRIGMPSVWDRTRGAANVVVAVLDTGVAGGHPDLQGAILPGFNFVDPAKAPSDDNGHGTAVAGIIAARANNHQGVAGLCWTCSILPIKVLGADGSGDTSQVAAGIVRAADAGARVISMSLGGPVDDRTLDDAIAYAAGKGAILVAAAGNNGASAQFYPAANPDVISVAATDQSDRLYSWSNFGTWVQIAAPGCNAAPGLSRSYVLFCGTSSATPIVAGLAALLLSEQPNAGRGEIADAIESTATPIGGVVMRGRIDAPRALSAVAAAPAPAEAVATSVLTVKSFLTPRVPARVYRRTIRAGRLTATVTFSGTSTLSLAIRNEAGALVASTAGASPLRLSRKLAAGKFSFAVSSRKANAGFTLVVSLAADPQRTGP